MGTSYEGIISEMNKKIENCLHDNYHGTFEV